MKDREKTFVRLLRMAVGCDEVEPLKLPEREWKAVYWQACRQSLTGLIYGVVSRMGGDVGIPRGLMLEWTCKAEAIRGFNAKMNAEAARLTRWFADRGRRTAILKGQANARLYPHPDERQPGDIDIWVEGGRESVVKLLTDEGLKRDKDEVTYHHVHLKKNADKISVEVHFRPSSGNHNPFSNRRLQHYLESEITRSSECPEGFCIPTYKFALLMQLSHIQRHFMEGGVGLRQIIDYYMLLSHASDEDRKVVDSQLSASGLRNMAGAVMWLMGELFSMKTSEMICKPDDYRGRILLGEVFKSGNFGHYSPRHKKGFWYSATVGRLRPIRLLSFSFQEGMWTFIRFLLYFPTTIPKRIRNGKFSLRKTEEE